MPLRFTLRFVVALCLLSCFHISNAWALSDAALSRDHPFFRRPSGYRIVSYTTGDGSLVVPIRDGTLPLSGRQTYRLYRTEGQPLSSSALGQRFLSSLQRAGGTVEFKENPALGGQRIVGRLSRDGRDVWVMQDVLSLREYLLTVLETRNNRTPLPPALVPVNTYELEAQVLDMLHLLERTGKLELPANFAKGTAALLRGYQTDFQKLVLLMEKDPSLKFRLETYAEPNMKPADQRLLLRERALTLVETLANMGANKKRFSTAPGDATKETAVPRGIVRLSTIDSIIEE